MERRVREAPSVEEASRQWGEGGAVGSPEPIFTVHGEGGALKSLVLSTLLSDWAQGRDTIRVEGW